MDRWDEDDPVDATALAWLRERPGTPVAGIGIVTRVWRLAKLFGEDRRRILAVAGADPAILDLLSVLRRAGAPYRLTTRELTERTRVTAGAISQRVARAEISGLVNRAPAGDGSRAVIVTLTPAGHALVESLVDQVLHREAELISCLAPHQRATLTELLRLLLDDVEEQVGGHRHTQVGST
ncbi:MAG: MarR family transcriptional regulator [Actinomycetota bacterium]|nr:MarR family transcriptional regulator [Actinomycetota bacterium]